MISIFPLKKFTSLSTPYLSGIFFAILCLIPRWDGMYFPGKYLWAEDGTVFINQLIELRWSSVTTAYMGYLHTYPRVVMLLASLFEFVNWSAVMLLGWLVSYLILIVVMIRTARHFGINTQATIALILVISLQPHSGEVFFNLTNSQWMLGAAYSLIVVMYITSSLIPSKATILFLMLLGLTGPFSILLLIVTGIYSTLNKEIHKNLKLIVTIFICATLQLFFLLKSSRATEGIFDVSLLHWFFAFIKLILFGDNIFINIIAVFLWCFIIFSLFKTRNAKQTKNCYKAAILLLFIACLFVVAGEYACKENPMSTSARYTWIPYTSIFFASVILTKESRQMTYVVFSLLMILCWKSAFEVKSSQNLQLKSFLSYSNVKDLIVPVEPSSQEFPGWHIKKYRDHNNLLFKSIEFPREVLDVKHNDTAVSVYTPEIQCPKPSDIGLEVNISRDVGGPITAYWSKNKDFRSDASLARYYPEGKVSADFAFPSAGRNFVRVDIQPNQAKYKIDSLKIYCLYQEK